MHWGVAPSLAWVPRMKMWPVAKSLACVSQIPSDPRATIVNLSAYCNLPVRFGMVYNIIWWQLILSLYFKIIIIINLKSFLEQLYGHSQTEQKVDILRNISCPRVNTANHTLKILQYSGTSVRINEPTWKHHHGPYAHDWHYGSLLVIYILWVWTNNIDIS